MSMGTMSMNMPASETAMAAMASMTGMSSMTGGNMTSMESMMEAMMATMIMPMQNMMMVFFTSTTTPLYSMQWIPSSIGQYAGTCIFLIALAMIFRGILAVRSNFSNLMAKWTHWSETDILRSDFDRLPDSATGTSMRFARRRPWRTNEALARAILDTILAGVSYLLMLAVMTMNVGYFMSILGGTFLGSFVFGGWTAPASH